MFKEWEYFFSYLTRIYILPASFSVHVNCAADIALDLILTFPNAMLIEQVKTKTMEIIDVMISDQVERKCSRILGLHIFILYMRSTFTRSIHLPRSGTDSKALFGLLKSIFILIVSMLINHDINNHGNK